MNHPVTHTHMTSSIRLRNSGQQISQISQISQIPPARGHRFVCEFLHGFGLSSVLIGLALPLTANAIDYRDDYRDSHLSQQQRAPADTNYPPAFGPYKPHPAQGDRGQSNHSSMMSYQPASRNSDPAVRYLSSDDNRKARASSRVPSFAPQQHNVQSSNKRYRPWDAEPITFTSSDGTLHSRGPFSYRPESRQPLHSQARPKLATRSQQTTATGPVYRGNATNSSWSYGPSSDPGERYWGPQANSTQVVPRLSAARSHQTGSAPLKRSGQSSGQSSRQYPSRYLSQYPNQYLGQYSGPYRGQSSTRGSVPAYSAAGNPWWGSAPSSTGMNVGRSRGKASAPERGRASPPVGVDAGEYYWGIR